LLARSPARPLLGWWAIERTRRLISTTEMGAADALGVVDLLEEAGIRTWVSGGWGCDALLGEQTRQHEDLDLILDARDQQPSLELLQQRGFTVWDVFTAGLLTLTVELIDRRRRLRVGLHFVDIDAEGPDSWRSNLSAAVQERMAVTAPQPFAPGVIEGSEVQCLSAAVQLALRVGYEHSDKDNEDVRRLASRFSLPLPPGYEPADGSR
jgi:lincosamide nucleotidyltransferase A/C/D/E